MLTPVPEPSGLVLLGTGAVILLGCLAAASPAPRLMSSGMGRFAGYATITVRSWSRHRLARARSIHDAVMRGAE